FVDEAKKNDLLEAGKVIEIRCYETIHGPWYYFTVDDGQVDLSNGDYIVIATVESFVNLRNYYGKDVVVPIYIEIDDGVRLERALKRERKQAEPKYEEMCRRFLADSKDFSKEKLDEAGITNIFNNEDDRNNTTEAIATFIKG
ncbi:MAG: guanylate kinase, partial [Pseudobutyrivibrio sp.]|nr:guanylate kinase [Pseudobutyrivibrio sp.]